MIFSELYSTYYRTVAQILCAATDHLLQKEELRAIAERYAFGESILTIEPALKDARDRGLVILGGDVFDEKMRETWENWCYQPVWTPSYSEFSKTSSENSFRRAAEYVKLWAGENVYFSLVVQDVTEAYIYAAGR